MRVQIQKYMGLPQINEKPCEVIDIFDKVYNIIFINDIRIPGIKKAIKLIILVEFYVK